MTGLRLFHEIKDNPKEYAVQWKNEKKGKVVGHFCSYTPIEIITAAGALPYRIFNTGAEISRADEFLQAYSCSLVRGAFEDALSGQLDFLDGTVFPHTCDSIMRLSDIWRMNAGLGFHLDLVLPVKLNTKSARDYMMAVLKRFRSDFQKAIGVEITDDLLREGIGLTNRVKENLGKLYAIRRQDPSIISSRDIHAIFKASMVMDMKEFGNALETLLDTLKDEGDSGTADKRVVLTGGICGMPDIYHIIEDAGGAVVWDDFCTGSRYFEGSISETGDPLESIGERYLERVICPAKHSELFARGDYLVNMVKENQAKGVIFLFLKFCDPHSFDYPYMKELLDKQGIPSMLFEIEDQFSSLGQLKTRCEAFMELL
ncbi:MAG: 2-hydroxyacyl-CoA dehydratase [Desulfobacterales bacterium]|nr:2-hydroxyacyl-CoA dehydratase [Desulfobacterales bacterium]